jgi:hypothetical protein
MADKPVVQIVSGTPGVDRETAEKFYRWLDEVHVSNIFKYKGIKRYLNCRKITDFQPVNSTVTDYPEHISIHVSYSQKDAEGYKDSPEHKYAAKIGLETWGDTIGRKKIWLVAYEETKTWEREPLNKDKRAIQIVAFAPPSDPVTAEKFYRWLDDVLVPRQFEFKGIIKATNYRRVEAELAYKPLVTDYPYFITIFEFNSRQDIENYMSSIEKGLPRPDWGPDITYKYVWLVNYQITKFWER